MDYEYSLVIKSAWYYYIENLTQQAISEKLGITRIKVVKLLEKARQDGVINFKIRRDGELKMELEKELQKKWNLQDAFVIPSPADNSEITESIAKAAAMYVNERLSENRFINMGYGNTANKILNFLSNLNTNPVSVVSLTGGVNIYLPSRSVKYYNTTFFLIPTPLRVSSIKLRDELLQENSVKDIMQMIQGAAMTVISVGGLNHDATLINNNILTKNDFNYLSMQGAVGDILSHFVDKFGNPVETEVEKCFLSVSLEQLSNLKNVVGVAAGKTKVDIIKAALYGNYLDVLITDEETAVSLLADNDN